MAFKPGSIEDIKSLISSKGGLAKTNLYYVLLPSWKENGLGATAKPQELGVLCRSISLPSRQLATLQRMVGPDKQDIVYGYQNPNVSMTFRVLNDQSTRAYFETWQQNIIQNNDRSSEGNYSIAFPDEYMKNIFVYQLERGRSLPVFNKNKTIDLGPVNLNLDIDIDLLQGGGANYQWALFNSYPVTYQSETLTDDGGPKPRPTRPEPSAGDCGRNSWSRTVFCCRLMPGESCRPHIHACGPIGRFGAKLPSCS